MLRLKKKKATELVYVCVCQYMCVLICEHVLRGWVVQRQEIKLSTFLISELITISYTLKRRE